MTHDQSSIKNPDWLHRHVDRLKTPGVDRRQFITCLAGVGAMAATLAVGGVAAVMEGLPNQMRRMHERPYMIEDAEGTRLFVGDYKDPPTMTRRYVATEKPLAITRLGIPEGYTWFDINLPIGGVEQHDDGGHPMLIVDVDTSGLDVGDTLDFRVQYDPHTVQDGPFGRDADIHMGRITNSRPQQDGDAYDQIMNMVSVAKTSDTPINYMIQSLSVVRYDYTTETLLNSAGEGLLDEGDPRDKLMQPTPSDVEVMRDKVGDCRGVGTLACSLLNKYDPRLNARLVAVSDNGRFGLHAEVQFEFDGRFVTFDPRASSSDGVLRRVPDGVVPCPGFANGSGQPLALQEQEITFSNQPVG